MSCQWGIMERPWNNPTNTCQWDILAFSLTTHNLHNTFIVFQQFYSRGPALPAQSYINNYIVEVEPSQNNHISTINLNNQRTLHAYLKSDKYTWHSMHLYHDRTIHFCQNGTIHTHHNGTIQSQQDGTIQSQQDGTVQPGHWNVHAPCITVIGSSAGEYLTSTV